MQQKMLVSDSAIICGDVREILPQFPSDFVQCCVTSPPYWGLRDYGVDYQIGAEDELSDYIHTLVSVFAQVKRVLKPDGILWLNIGDSYTSGGRTWRAPDKKLPQRGMQYRPNTPQGLKPKDLIGIPWRVAFALQEDGWYLRSEIIWEKPNAMPESVKDRPTRVHEHIFMLTKSEKYFYDSESVQENGNGSHKRNRRSVWSVNTEPFKGSHFATFPPKLVVPCILSATRENDYVIDPFFGSGTVGLVAKQLDRRYIGIEVNPDYVEIARDRINPRQTRFTFG